MRFRELLCLLFGHRFDDGAGQLCRRCRRWSRPTWLELRRQQQPP